MGDTELWKDGPLQSNGADVKGTVVERSKVSEYLVFCVRFTKLLSKVEGNLPQTIARLLDDMLERGTTKKGNDKENESFKKPIVVVYLSEYYKEQAQEIVDALKNYLKGRTAGFAYVTNGAIGSNSFAYSNINDVAGVFSKLGF